MLWTALMLAVAFPIHAPSSQALMQPQRKPELYDAVADVYEGDVISDARGSHQAGVTSTVRRIGKNLVEVTSD